MGYLNTVGVGNSIDYLKQVPDCSVDSACGDPPYGLGDEPSVVAVMDAWLNGREYVPQDGSKGFMGETWDAFVPSPAIWREVYRVLKPGAYCVMFFGTRTYDWGVMAMRIAGFEIVDQIVWHHGTGFPKSLNISKAVDAFVTTGNSDSKALKYTNDEVRTGEGRERESATNNGIMGETSEGRTIRDEPATPIGKRWEGWGTQLKPSSEPIVLARKPFPGTFAENVLKHGTGAMNIDASRISGPSWGKKGPSEHGGRTGKGIVGDSQPHPGGEFNPAGRWPANVIFSHAKGCELVGTKRVTTGTAVRRHGKGGNIFGGSGRPKLAGPAPDHTHADEDGKEEVEDWQCAPGCPVTELSWQQDGAPRFFYCPKAQTKHRWAYCKDCAVVFKHNKQTFKAHEDHEVMSHPTQKPVALMEYLIKLVTQPGGVVVDPFCGTGTTAVAAKTNGFNFITCELDANYAKIAEARIGTVGMEPSSALTNGAVFCPGCKAKGEIKLISQADIERSEASGRKITCSRCMKRYTSEELKGLGSNT